VKTRHLEGTEDLNPDKICEPQIRYAKTRQANVLFALSESWLDNFSIPNQRKFLDHRRRWKRTEPCLLKHVSTLPVTLQDTFIPT